MNSHSRFTLTIVAHQYFWFAARKNKNGGASRGLCGASRNGITPPYSTRPCRWPESLFSASFNGSRLRAFQGAHVGDHIADILIAQSLDGLHLSGSFHHVLVEVRIAFREYILGP